MVKKFKIDKMVAQVAAQKQAVKPDDLMAEAGRKVLLGEFLKMLKHDPGSRTGEDPEDVHKMRVAIRQMRSAFRLLGDSYKPKSIRDIDSDLKWVMRALGPVRDLDVMIQDLSSFDTSLSDEQSQALQEVIHALDQRRIVARANLNSALDSKAYRRFLKSYSEFLLTPGVGVRNIEPDDVAPVEVRHLLPPMIYEHLAAVRAYDRVIAEAEVAMLHALRIEFKRLRYVVTLFSEVLGKDIAGFIDELKMIQDDLGRLNDIEVARQFLLDFMDDLEPDQSAVLRMYLDQLEADQPDLVRAFPAKWKRFNAKTVQRKLANAVLVL